MNAGLFYANVGADGVRSFSDIREQPAVRAVSGLCRFLVGAQAAGIENDAFERTNFKAHYHLPERPAFDWIPADQMVSWFNDPDAEDCAKRHSVSLFGANPEATRRAHDKAFAIEASKELSILPEPLAETVHVFSAADLQDAERATEHIYDLVDKWPTWTLGKFTLKPRQGTSARGRVAGTSKRGEVQAVRGALPRLAAFGGAILEPWLARRADFSTQMYIDSQGSVHILGTLQQVTMASGFYLGHRGVMRGDYVHCDHAVHDELALHAEAVGKMAARVGYRGPAGVDAFSFLAGKETHWRWASEFNARFTTGTLTLSILRWARETLKLTGTVPFEFRLGVSDLTRENVLWSQQLNLAPHTGGLQPTLYLEC